MNKSCFFYFLLILLPCSIIAQNNNTLSFKQAAELLLKNNFDIQLAQNNATIADINNTYGNAGFLPKVDINAGISTANNKTNQEFSNGLTVNKSGVGSQNYNAGMFLSWTVFDGMKMFATKERLNLLEQQGELSTKISIEQQLEQLINLYYTAVMQTQLIKGIEVSMQVTEERIKIYQRKLEIGSGSNVELLQAKLDYNAQKSNLLTQKLNLAEYKNNLKVLIKANLDQDFAVDTVIDFEPEFSLEAVKQKIEQSNQLLLFAKKNTDIISQSLKEAQSLTLPKISLQSAYNFTNSKSTAGFALLNQNLGYSFGITSSWNIFNGFNTRNKIKVAKIQVRNSQIEVDRIKYNLWSSAYTTYQKLKDNIEILSLEEQNIELAKEALQISTERLKTGLGNYLEIKESQNSYETALTRLVNARYNLKMTETSLKKLTGTLIN